jgi:hypothetical protein
MNVKTQATNMGYCKHDGSQVHLPARRPPCFDMVHVSRKDLPARPAPNGAEMVVVREGLPVCRNVDCNAQRTLGLGLRRGCVGMSAHEDKARDAMLEQAGGLRTSHTHTDVSVGVHTHMTREPLGPRGNDANRGNTNAPRLIHVSPHCSPFQHVNFPAQERRLRPRLLAHACRACAPRAVCRHETWSAFSAILTHAG